MPLSGYVFTDLRTFLRALLISSFQQDSKKYFKAYRKLIVPFLGSRTGRIPARRL